MSIGGDIKGLRKKKSLTADHPSELVQSLPPLIFQVERSKADPSISISIRKKIAEVNVVDFFFPSFSEDGVITRVHEEGWVCTYPDAISYPV